MKKQHRPLAIFGALALVTAGLAVNPPHASVQFLTHDLDDPSPRRFQTVIAVGGAALQLLITWTSRRSF